MKTRFILILLLSFPFLLFAKGSYQEPHDFIAQAFNSLPPKPSVMWITGDTKDGVKKIMEHDLTSLRLRYWGKAQRTAWVLDEIGKEKPITVGIIVNQNQIEQVKVLVFRESRGGEVRYPFFTEQFLGSQITTNHSLSQNVDGISGATLSVRALKKLATLALYLHKKSQFNHEE